VSVNNVIEILRDTHRLPRGPGAGAGPPDAEQLDKLRQRYDTRTAAATTQGMCWAVGCASTRSRCGCSPARPPCTGLMTNAGPRRPSATMSGYWHTQHTLARWCRIRSPRRSLNRSSRIPTRPSWDADNGPFLSNNQIWMIGAVSRIGSVDRDAEHPVPVC
jgi:hypothetical protein